jgi:hypothetical protein
MSTPLTRRSFTAGSLAIILGGGALASFPSLRLVSAQEATDLASLGLPTLDVTVTDTGYEGLPEETTAGRYLVNATIPESMAEGGGVAFMSPPPGMTADEFLSAVGMGGGAPDASPMASPPPESGAGEEEEVEEGGEEENLPLFIYKATFAGGAAGMGGTTAQAVVDLMPGEWIAWADDPSAAQQPVIFTVTGEMPTDLVEPEADVTVTYIDFGISVEGTLTAGDHLMLLQNHGAQPHFLFLAKGPDSMTNEQIAQILDAEMSGTMTPEALPFDPDNDLMPVLFTATQSIGTMQWVPASLEAGTYAALCFFPTAGEGLPHAYHGMHTVFMVE